MTANKPVTVGISVVDIEDAILQGQEEFIRLMADVQSEYIAPLIEQMAAMQLATLPPEQRAQIMAQMKETNSYG